MNEQLCKCGHDITVHRKLIKRTWCAGSPGDNGVPGINCYCERFTLEPSLQRPAEPEQAASDELREAARTGVELARLTAELSEAEELAERYKTALDGIRFYTEDHAEPGYECVQCLIDNIAREALAVEEGQEADQGELRKL